MQHFKNINSSKNTKKKTKNTRDKKRNYLKFEFYWLKHQRFILAIEANRIEALFQLTNTKLKKKIKF